MRVLFLTLLGFESLAERNIYTDLLREFAKNGHDVFAISPTEKREGQRTHIVREDHATILRLQIGDTQKTSTIKKGINTLRIEPLFIKAIKKHFSSIKFDLVLYSTPPITFCKAIEFVKKRDGAKTYLLLKDIFPQNAVDLGMMKTTGPMSVIYRSFRNKEKRLYAISDRIGCMSPANVEYVIKHNPQIDANKVEVCPNSIEVIDRSISAEDRASIRQKYQIPLDKKVFVYGGNLGKPQCIPFIIECLMSCTNIEDAFFLIVGDGTDYPMLEEYANTSKQRNLKLLRRLPKDDYDRLVAACDVGMIFLDYRFTIPNFPSRLLSYMQAGLPVLAVTDPNSDIGEIIEKERFGWWCLSNNAYGFANKIRECEKSNLKSVGINSYEVLKKRYSVSNAFLQIVDGIER